MWVAAAAVAVWTAPTVAVGQIAEHVRGVDDGVVRFAYETRDGVEVCDQGIRIGEHHMWWRSRGSGDRAQDCRVGVVEVELEVRNGEVRGVDIVRGLDDRVQGAEDLGTVSAPDASAYLLSLAYQGATHDGAEEALMPAMLADVEDIWRDVIDVAKDRSVHEGVRKNALFWLGQEAADAATEGLADVALDEDEDQEIRNSAIFALSQRPDDEGIPALMEVARTGDHAETRRTAMFWLAQADDDRVVAFFEDILIRRIR